MVIGMVLPSCAAPAVTMYALGVSGSGGTVAPLQAGAMVIEVARITLPDYLDTQDIVVRRGSVLERKQTGRWAGRLSLGATSLLANRLAASAPTALVTDQPQMTAPTFRLAVNISRLDISDAEATAGHRLPGQSVPGEGILNADWMIVPLDPALPTLRNRIGINIAGPVGSDRDIVVLETALLIRLADAIDLGHLR